ncbi:hypothetical protein [Ammonifex degensii]|nr:hypothetical protein [Ammonifex degensii]
MSLRNMYEVKKPGLFHASRRKCGENFVVLLQDREAGVLVSGDPSDAPDVLTVVGWGKVYVLSPCTVKAYGNGHNGGLVVFAEGPGVRVEANDGTVVYAKDGAEVLVKSPRARAFGINARLSVLGEEVHEE